MSFYRAWRDSDRQSICDLRLVFVVEGGLIAFVVKQMVGKRSGPDRARRNAEIFRRDSSAPLEQTSNK